MIKDEDYILIENFLKGELSKSDSDAFEQRLLDDMSFKSDFESYKISLEVTDLLVEKGLDKRLNELRSMPEVKQAKVRRMGWKKWLSVAAVVGLCLLVGRFIFPSQMTTQELTATYFEPYEVQIRGGEIEDVYQAFSNGAYDQAIFDLSQVDDSNVSFEQAQFFLGQAYFLSGDFKNAIKSFQPLNEMTDFQYSEAVVWYLALSELNVNETAGKRYLDQIIKSGSSYAFRARELRKKLEN